MFRKYFNSLFESTLCDWVISLAKSLSRCVCPPSPFLLTIYFFLGTGPFVILFPIVYAIEHFSPSPLFPKNCGWIQFTIYNSILVFWQNFISWCFSIRRHIMRVVFLSFYDISSHWWLRSKFIISFRVTEWWYSNSVIPSSFICWNFSLKKNFLSATIWHRSCQKIRIKVWFLCFIHKFLK